MRNIRWKILLSKTSEQIYNMLVTDKGRALFWAESAIERDNHIHFQFINGFTERSEVLTKEPYRHFVINYFGVETTFEIDALARGKTILSLHCKAVPDDDYEQTLAGWVSVLMNLKAVLEYDADLRNHDPKYCWDQQFADN